MDLSEKTLSTQFHCDERTERLLHATMGMLTEVEELLDNHSGGAADEINRAEEWGDMAWYLAILGREYSMDLVGNQANDGVQGTIISITKDLLRLLDMLKKSIYYGKRFDDGTARELVGRVMSGLVGYARDHGIDPASALNANIEKLRARYGGKFSSESAINRDLGNERRILTDNL